MKRVLPFRVAYSNDFTNITACRSPFHAPGQPYSREMLDAAVGEVAGLADAHFLQLGTGRVPWYPSRIDPPAAYRDWYCAHYGVSPAHPVWTTGLYGYLLRGGDPLADFIRSCRKHRQKCVISLRLNDQHGLDMVDSMGSTAAVGLIGRFYAEHPEYRLYPTGRRNDRCMNWAYDEVRETLLALIEEQAAAYALDGYELDFQRHPRFFRLEETTVLQRVEIMNGFLRSVRAILDRHSRDGRRPYLSVRVPCYRVLLDECGLDVTAFSALGVDLCVVSDHYFASLDTEFETIRSMLGDVSCFFEICHTTYSGRDTSIRETSLDDVFSYRRTTPEQIRTLANAAYHQGADGISFYNFPYYREYGSISRGPFSEPPFSVIGECRDASALTACAQDYLLTPGWSCWPFDPVSRVKDKQLPRVLRSGEREAFHMNLYPPDEICRPVSILRLQFETELDAEVFAAEWNGARLTPSDDIREPYGARYPQLLGDARTLRAFELPTERIRKGRNDFSVVMSGGGEAKLIAVNIPIR